MGFKTAYAPVLSHIWSQPPLFTQGEGIPPFVQELKFNKRFELRTRLSAEQFKRQFSQHVRLRHH